MFGNSVVELSWELPMRSDRLLSLFYVSCRCQGLGMGLARLIECSWSGKIFGTATEQGLINCDQFCVSKQWSWSGKFCVLP